MSEGEETPEVETCNCQECDIDLDFGIACECGDLCEWCCHENCCWGEMK